MVKKDVTAVLQNKIHLGTIENDDEQNLLKFVTSHLENSWLLSFSDLLCLTPSNEISSLAACFFNFVFGLLNVF